MSSVKRETENLVVVVPSAIEPFIAPRTLSLSLCLLLQGIFQKTQSIFFFRSKKCPHKCQLPREEEWTSGLRSCGDFVLWVKKSAGKKASKSPKNDQNRNSMGTSWARQITYRRYGTSGVKKTPRKSAYPVHLGCHLLSGAPNLPERRGSREA